MTFNVAQGDLISIAGMATFRRIRLAGYGCPTTTRSVETMAESGAAVAEEAAEAAKVERHDVVVVGAGVSGIYQIKRLADLGVDAVLLEGLGCAAAALI